MNSGNDISDCVICRSPASRQNGFKWHSWCQCLGTCRKAWCSWTCATTDWSNSHAALVPLFGVLLQFSIPSSKMPKLTGVGRFGIEVTLECSKPQSHHLKEITTRRLRDVTRPHFPLNMALVRIRDHLKFQKQSRLSVTTFEKHQLTFTPKGVNVSVLIAYSPRPARHHHYWSYTNAWRFQYTLKIPGYPVGFSTYVSTFVDSVLH